MPSKARYFQSALSLSALGDALGWPQEFKYRQDSPQVRNFKNWNKRSGGKYWAYEDPIRTGEYSDDTQLMLALARSIQANGDFWPEHFAYLELPLWLHYERGGGRATKQAAKNLLKYKTLWYENTFGKQGSDYLNAGGNGAAMRTLPLSLAYAHDLPLLLINTLSQSIVTHGHPRSFIGSLTIACAHHLLIQDGKMGHRALGHLIKHELTQFFMDQSNWPEGLQHWWKQRPQNYLELCLSTLEEILEMLRLIPDYLKLETAAYYDQIGCLSRQTKGSGTATVAAAIFLYFRHLSQPEESIYTAANLLGSDTDTIACMVGGLVGLHIGDAYSPHTKHLLDQLQDLKYFNSLGSHLHQLRTAEPETILFGQATSLKPDKKETLKMVLSWEMGLHELFWNLLDIGDMISHPTLGMGHLELKEIFPIAQKPDYEARVFKVSFDTKQSVYFHSRISKEDWKVNQSLEVTVRKSLVQASNAL